MFNTLNNFNKLNKLKAYYAKCRLHHPDKCLNDPLATTRFQWVVRAYQILSVQQKRFQEAQQAWENLVVPRGCPAALFFQRHSGVLGREVGGVQVLYMFCILCFIFMFCIFVLFMFCIFFKKISAAPRGATAPRALFLKLYFGEFCQYMGKWGRKCITGAWYIMYNIKHFRCCLFFV